jgi:hypothetical protein
MAFSISLSFIIKMKEDIFLYGGMTHEKVPVTVDGSRHGAGRCGRQR